MPYLHPQMYKLSVYVTKTFQNVEQNSRNIIKMRNKVCPAPRKLVVETHDFQIQFLLHLACPHLVDHLKSWNPVKLVNTIGIVLRSDT